MPGSTWPCRCDAVLLTDGADVVPVTERGELRLAHLCERKAVEEPAVTREARETDDGRSVAGSLAVHLGRHGPRPVRPGDRELPGCRDRRPSTLYATARGSQDQIERVEVGGSAVIVARGELQL
jgi:hypothetical protein